MCKRPAAGKRLGWLPPSRGVSESHTCGFKIYELWGFGFFARNRAEMASAVFLHCGCDVL